MERTLQTFLDFARPPQPDRRRLDLAEVVDRVYALVGGRARKQRVALRLLRPDDAGLGGRGPGPAPAAAAEPGPERAGRHAATAGRWRSTSAPPRDGHVESTSGTPGRASPRTSCRKVFETFVSSKETGLGLGLPVSRRIAEDHGGTLSAYNLPDGGRVLRPPAARPGLTPAPRFPPEELMPTLLVVDDEPSILHFFRRAFPGPDVTLLTAASAAEGLAAVARERPDVVILDINLPDESGLETFRRDPRRDPKVPVIFITGHGTTATGHRGDAARAPTSTCSSRWNWTSSPTSWTGRSRSAG